MPKYQRTLVGPCNTCGNTIKLGIGDYTVEEVKEQLSGGPFQCPGRHSELSSAYPHHWKIDDWTLEEAEIATEEEFTEELRSRYKEVLTAPEMQELGVITSFAFGLPITDDGKHWDFTHSPEGKRYYYCGLRSDD